MNRREFLQYILASSSPALFSSCSIFRPKPNPCGLFDRHLPSPEQNKLIIDVHAHFFNGSDLQVAKFVSQVAGREIVDWVWLREIAGKFLQLLAWELAPSAKDELSLISSYKDCEMDRNSELIKMLRDKQFHRAKSETIKALYESISDVSTPEVMFIIKKFIKNLPESYDELYEDDGEIILSAHERKILSENLGIQGASFKQVFRFVVEMFQFRYVSASNYLNAYNTQTEKIDIAISSLVDYDWFLAKGEKTKSTLEDQIMLMGKISKLSKGIVNYFVPYCPLRHLAYLKGKQTSNPMELVESAVFEHGAMGVKIYPPMGFAPWGNEVIQKEIGNIWIDKDYLPDIARTSTVGADLDACLSEFYSYCQQHQIPIMAHTSVSNLSHDDFDVIFSQENLRELLFDVFPDLYMNFGHFGGFGWHVVSSSDDDEVILSDSIWRELSDLIKAQYDIGASSLYADTGFSSDALENKQKFKEVFLQLLKRRKELVERMVYGTDWKMIVTQKNVNKYLKVFQEILFDSDVQSLAGNIGEKIIGKNAVGYLRLASTQPSRERILDFFSEMDGPHWINKID